MAFILRAFLALALMFTSIASFSAPIWFGDDDGAHRVNTDTNRVDLTIRSVDPVALAINANDGSLWVLTANRVLRYRSDGTYQSGAFLRTFSNSIGDGLALALNPNDGSLWVAGQNRLLLLNANGGLLRQIDVSTQDLSVAQDGTLWLLARDGAIRHYGSNGALLHSVSPDGPGHGRDNNSYGNGNNGSNNRNNNSANGTYLALDDTGGALWIADGKDLTKRSLSDPGHVLLSKRLPESVNDMSLDVQSGELWVIGDRSLFTLTRAGSVILTRDLRDSSISNPNTVVFDFATQGVWVGHQHGISRLDVDGRLIAAIRANDAVNAIAIGRAPVDVTPTLALAQPLPNALVNSAQPVIAFRYGANCSGIPCGFPNSYFSTYVLSAQLNGAQVGQLFAFNAATGSASLTPPAALPQGVNQISGQVTDSFGRQSEAVTAQFYVDSIAPLFANVTPASGSVFASAQITIRGNVDDATATVRLSGVAAPLGTSFSFPVTLNAGANNFSLTATDPAGNVTTLPLAYSFSVPNSPPIVAITSPADGANFTAPANVTVTASASDPGGSVASVEFFSNGTSVGIRNAAPYTIALTGLAAGNYALTAKATDNLGASTLSAPVNITVGTPVNSPPIVAITAPAGGASFNAPAGVTVTASASDPGGSVASVEFFSNGTSVGIRTALPYSVALTGLAAGSYAFTAKATDNLGLSTLSAPVDITVVTPNSLPSVAITSPASGAVFTAPATIQVKAAASDSDGTIDHVDFLRNGVVAGTLTSAPYNFTLTGVPAGAHALSARAVDNRGGTTTSASVNVTVNALTLAIASPANGAAVDGNTVLVTGSISAPAGSGVAVNGVLAGLSGANYTALVPVVAGSNTLTAMVTAPEGQTASQSVTVTATGVAPAIKFKAEPDTGLAPLAVTFTVNNPTAQDASFTFDGFGPFALPARGTATLGITYPAGVFTPTVVVTEATGTTFQSLVIEVLDEAALDQQLRAIWSGLNDALIAGNKDKAMSYLNLGAQAKYGPVFDSLMPFMPQIVGSYSPLAKGKIGAKIGEYAVRRSYNGVNKIYLIYFVRDMNGIWHIDEM
jgi:hypothetical protein